MSLKDWRLKHITFADIIDSLHCPFKNRSEERKYPNVTKNANWSTVIVVCVKLCNLS